MDWEWISYWGDSTVLLPSAFLLFIVLFYSDTDRKIAWSWACLFGGTALVVCISKLAFIGWGIGIKNLDFIGFSGHAALSACFWPVLFFLLSSHYSTSTRYFFVMLGVILALLIGYSRLETRAHSTSEVVLGLMLGLTASILFVWLQHAKKNVLSYQKMMILIVFTGALLIIYKPMPTQSFLEKMVTIIDPSKKPYTRTDVKW